MTHRRPDPRQAMLEQALRRALRRAVDTIEPGADGLDRIRAKIAAGPPAPAEPAGWVGWRTRYLNGLLAALSAAAAYLEPAAIRIRYACGAVVERFRPEQGATGLVAWLRPAAAVATGLLVVVGASWAIAALPPALIKISGNTNTLPPGISSSARPPASPGGYGAGGQVSKSGSVSPSSSPSCPAPASASPSPSGSPSQSGSSPSSSPSPTSTSPSPSPSSSTSGAGSGSPSSSPTSGPTQGPGLVSQSAAPLAGGAAPPGPVPQPNLTTGTAQRTASSRSGGSRSCP